jgi:clan AA aspartic protease (TIGR02281 family)
MSKNIYNVMLFFFACIIVPNPALAFICDDVRLASSIVICSDPELMRLADERQNAFNWARFVNPDKDDEMLITPEEDLELRNNQRDWVRNYATNCGVPPHQPPPNPVSQSIINCFKKAGQDRIAWLRAYRNRIIVNGHDAARRTAVTDEINLKKEGGTYLISVQINGAITLNFIIDSGASDVQIPVDVFLTLVRTDTIHESDLKGEKTYTLADGSKKKTQAFIIRELKVGKHVLQNVRASVGPSTGPLLLGQSFLSEFDTWIIDNRRQSLRLVPKLTQDHITQDKSSSPTVAAIYEKPVPKLKESQRWLQVASRAELQEAISIAKNYKKTFPNTMVIKSINDYYAIIVGGYNPTYQTEWITQLKSKNEIPTDSYFSTGRNFIALVWE